MSCGRSLIAVFSRPLLRSCAGRQKAQRMEIPRKLIDFTTLTLECMARDLFRTRPRISFAPPIDLEFMIENEGDVTLAMKDGLVARYNVEGCVLKEEASHDLHVWIDYPIYLGPWPRYNAVLAEEFSHIILHKSL